MDIVYTKSLNGLDKFPAWSGGKRWLDEFVEHPDALVYLEDYLEDLYEGGATFTDTDINDFLWFDAFDILVEEGFVDKDMNWKDEEQWIGYQVLCRGLPLSQL